MDIRKIGINGKTRFVSLPFEWGVEGEYVNIEIINDNELKLVKVSPKN